MFSLLPADSTQKRLSGSKGGARTYVDDLKTFSEPAANAWYTRSKSNAAGSSQPIPPRDAPTQGRRVDTRRHHKCMTLYQ